MWKKAAPWMKSTQYYKVYVQYRLGNLLKVFITWWLPSHFFYYIKIMLIRFIAVFFYSPAGSIVPSTIYECTIFKLRRLTANCNKLLWISAFHVDMSWQLLMFTDNHQNIRKEQQTNNKCSVTELKPLRIKHLWLSTVNECMP